MSARHPSRRPDGGSKAAARNTGDFLARKMKGCSRSPSPRLLAVVVTLLGLMALPVGSAAALPASFALEGTGAGEFVEPRGIAVDQESGDVFVADSGNNRIDEFGPEGEFLLAWGWGVADGKTEALQTCTAMCFAGLPGSGAGQLNGVEGIAVDNDPLSFSHGDVYVVDPRNSRVQKFNQQGGFLLMLGGKVDETTKASICTAEDIEAGDKCGEGVPGAGPGAFQGLAKHAVAVDPTTGTVYVGDEGRVQRFSETGTAQGEVAFPAAGSSENLAVDSAKDIYLKGSGLEGVRKYDGTGKELGAPRDEAGYGAAKAVAVGPAGEVFVNEFVGEGERHHLLAFNAEGQQTASFDAGGRAQDGERGIAYSEHAKAVYVLATGAVRVVTPPPPGPLVVSDGTSEIQPTTARLQATLNPEGATAKYHFEYGATTAYGGSTPVSAPLTAVNEVQSVAVAATGGAFTLTFKGERSADIPFNATAAEAQAALEGISGLGAGQVAVSGASGGPWSVEFTGARAGQSVPELSVGTGNLEGPEPSVVVAITTPGFSLFDDRATSAAVAGLLPGTLYHFRVVATNGSQTSEGPDQTFTTLPPVSVDATSVSEVDDESARLEAELNPHGVASEYHFEYDTAPYSEGEAPHGMMVPVTDGSLDADGTVSNLVQGLAPSTVYHYRVVARNALGEVRGPDHLFTTQGAVSSTLPDGRSWELVSPPNKHGAPLEAQSWEGGLIQAAPGGGALTYIAYGPLGPESKGSTSPEASQLLSNRDPVKGWSTQDISTAHEEITLFNEFKSAEYQFFSEDLSASIVSPQGKTPLSNETTEPTPYRREADGQFVPLVTAANVPAGTEFGGSVIFKTATPDLGHILLISDEVLAPGFAEGFVPSSREIYELSDGVLTLVSVLPDGKPAGEDGDAATVGGNARDMRGAISSDGSRVFFSVPGELLMRDVALSKTLQLDKAQPGAVGESNGGDFQAASSDGSRVFFTDTSRLTVDATARPNQPDLYMCEIAVSAGQPSCSLTDLTVDRNAGEAANVQGQVSAIDATGGHVYFGADGVLTLTPNARGEHAVAGEENMYEYDTVTRQIHFIATLSPGSGEGGFFPGDSSDVATGLEVLTARSSPDGRYFAFMSRRSLTGYDNRDVAGYEYEARPGGKSVIVEKEGRPVPARDEEVYLYSAETGRISCVSCDPTGARPHGVRGPTDHPGLLVDRQNNWADRWIAGSVPAWTQQDAVDGIAPYQPRYLSNGGRAFFDSPDALVPQDTNKVEDVYQYEPSGVGSCSSSSTTFSSSSGGCVNLISSGTSKEESAFLDASENGDEVFFLTQARLTTSDVDSALDVYDAHVCSASSPCPVAPSATPGCEGDTCQNPIAPPGEQTPGSLTYKGPGNVTPPAASSAARPKSLTRAQLLARALKTCKKGKARKKRVACERRARQKYGAKNRSTKATRRKK
jgi:hypothetical protein